MTWVIKKSRRQPAEYPRIYLGVTVALLHPHQLVLHIPPWLGGAKVPTSRTKSPPQKHTMLQVHIAPPPLILMTIRPPLSSTLSLVVGLSKSSWMPFALLIACCQGKRLTTTPLMTLRLRGLRRHSVGEIELFLVSDVSRQSPLVQDPHNIH
jgi:hypothetical protein